MTLPLVSDLLAPGQAPEYPLLRRLAGEVLKPGPWEHKIFTGAGMFRSTIPDPDTRPLAVIADELVKKVLVEKGSESLRRAVRLAFGVSGIVHVWSPEAMEWWLRATTAERIVCCLLALGKVRMK